jgi:hypothetical protein
MAGQLAAARAAEEAQRLQLQELPSTQAQQLEAAARQWGQRAAEAEQQAAQQGRQLLARQHRQSRGRLVQGAAALVGEVMQGMCGVKEQVQQQQHDGGSAGRGANQKQQQQQQQLWVEQPRLAAACWAALQKAAGDYPAAAGGVLRMATVTV